MGADLLGLGMKLQFDPFELDTDRAELRTVSGPVKLEPKVFRLLCLLVENNERVIGKDEMIAVVWAGSFHFGRRRVDCVEGCSQGAWG